MPPRSFLATILACALSFAAGRTDALDLMPRSFSRSRQFIVYARESALRNAVGTLGEENKNGTLDLLGLRDKWSIPIVVDLRPAEPGLPDARPPVRLLFAQTGDGLKIELHLLTGEGGRGTHIRDELVRTYLLSLAYQDETKLLPGKPYSLPPPWLVEGLSAYLENQENGVSASLYAALLPTLQTMSCTEFLGKDPAGMDSTSRAVYRAWAYNLVYLLVRELPSGRDGLAAFVRDLPNLPQDAANNAETLGRFFPELAASPDALAKWWTLALTRLATSDRYQIYSAEESERRLRALLTFPGPVRPKSNDAPTMVTLADFAKFTPLKQNTRVLANARNGLAALSAQASPFYQPIVHGYQEIVAQLSANRTKGVAERLNVLEALRRDALRQRDGITDHLNWYEATQATTRSSAFNEYFHASDQLSVPPRIHRPDPISAYMDSLDTEFQ